ncbi:MAG: hypothetical protein AB1810_00235 [Pseudomonadota bacterium]
MVKSMIGLIGAMLLVSLCACQQSAQQEGVGTTGTAGAGGVGDTSTSTPPPTRPPSEQGSHGTASGSTPAGN